MSDNNPGASPAAPSEASQTALSASPATGGTAPDGRDATILGGADAPTAAEPGKEATKEAPVAATPFDASKLSFPEELGKPDEGVLNKFGEVAKSANLSQEVAQQLADLHTETVKAASEANRQAWSTTIDAWENEIKTDKEIGGDKFDATKAMIAKVVHDPRFATPGFVEALNLTGFGSNPAAVRFFAKIASALTEGQAVTGTPPSQAAPRTAAQTLYPNLPSSESGD